MFPQAEFPAGEVSPDCVTNAVFKFKHKPIYKSRYSLPYISIISILMCTTIKINHVKS